MMTTFLAQTLLRKWWLNIPIEATIFDFYDWGKAGLFEKCLMKVSARMMDFQFFHTPFPYTGLFPSGSPCSCQFNPVTFIFHCNT